MSKTLSDYKHIMMLIGSNEVAGLHRLIAASLWRGTSPAVIVLLIEQSLAGLYSPSGGFSKPNLDIAFLVKSIGGPWLLYTLQKSHGLASLTTWDGGQQKAIDLLEEYFEDETPPNFSAIFSKEGFNLLRPNGDYVGTKSTGDDSRSKDDHIGQLTDEELHIEVAIKETTALNPHPAIVHQDDILPSSSPPESVYSSEAQSNENRTPAPKSHQEIAATASTIGADESAGAQLQELPNGLDIDNFFPDFPKTDPTAGEVLGKTFSKTLGIKGKTYLKSSIVTQLTADSKANKATLRPLRAQRVAMETF
ncbi:hypothetical protein B0H34DRAFT_800363 [Crassisporium funariophilum]|nr:hypothetical protein B0H34DRAFT_800363 [Crassisporium funariophilum]